MGSKTDISWTDSTWTPLRARVKSDAAEIAKTKGYSSLIQIAGKMAGRVGPHCEHASHGCDHCYSDTNNSRCLPKNGTGLPFDRRARDLVDLFLDDKMLMQPLHWKTPKKIFTCSQTDLFGEWVTDEQIDRVFAVMAMCPQHIFQVLTKRAERMQAWASRNVMGVRLQTAWGRIRGTGWGNGGERPWPLPNVWLGVSCEDQKTADERIPHLLRTPAVIRFLSYEPAIGPLRLWKLKSLDYHQNSAGYETYPLAGMQAVPDCDWEHPGLNWVICGGESGRGARPMHPDWARAVRDDCVKENVAFFFKQWGSFVPWDLAPKPMLDAGRRYIWPDGKTLKLGDSNGGLDYRGSVIVQKVNKAPTLLDGQEWHQFPEARV